MLWRYMDFAKYAFLLQEEKLHCPRGDQFEDKFEGSYPLKNTNDFKGFEFKGEDWKKFVTVSCWYNSECESDAMWRLYGLSKNCVAIVITEKSLNSLADENGGYVKEVEYIDFSYAKAQLHIPTDVFHYKRKAYIHESEVRLIKTFYPQRGFEGNIPKVSLPVEGKELPKGGEMLDIELSEFLTKVVVSPYANEWFYEVVNKITKSSGVSEELVAHSELSDDPVYAR